MQDILLCTIGIGILFTLIFIKQDTIPFYFVLSMGTAMSVGGILLALVTILKDCLSALASAFKTLYGVRIEAHQKGWLMTIIVKETEEIKGVPLVFLLLILLIGYILGLLM